MAASTVAVIGAGAFGGWTALMCLRAGAKVTLCDAWTPGHVRASSGGITRIIRSAYRDVFYARLAWRALELWKENCAAWQTPLYHQTGLLMMARAETQPVLEGVGRNMVTADIPYEMWDRGQLAEQQPQINPDAITRTLWEPEAGFLLASLATRTVAEQFVVEGGEFRNARCLPEQDFSGRITGLKLSTGETLQADHYVFACGPWMGELFPALLRPVLRVTRQEVFFFGTSPGSSRHSTSELPIWADIGEKFWYGIPANPWHEFKVADDTPGEMVDPTTQSRLASEQRLREARKYLAYRFPNLAAAPLVETRVCQYTLTPTEHLFAARHPQAENLWLAGGGSGHGFKHGPAIGELVAAGILETREMPEQLRLPG